MVERTYTGQFEAYGLQQVRLESGKATVRPSTEPGVPIVVPAIIDQATFDAANAAIMRPGSAGRPPVDQEAAWLRGHVRCGVCGSRMDLKRTTEGTYKYSCSNKKGSDGDCAGGDFTISTRALDGPVYEALAYILMRKDRLRELMLQRLGTDKRQVLASMAESYAAQIAEKKDLLETAKRRALQTSDDELARSFIRSAEELSSQVHALEQDYAQASEELDTFQADSAWVDATLNRIYDVVQPQPTPQDVRAFPYEERRLLLAMSGLRAEVYPTNWGGEREAGFTIGARTVVDRDGIKEITLPAPKRVEVFFQWKMSPSTAGLIQLIVTTDELRFG